MSTTATSAYGQIGALVEFNPINPSSPTLVETFPMPAPTPESGASLAGRAAVLPAAPETPLVAAQAAEIEESGLIDAALSFALKDITVSDPRHLDESEDIKSRLREMNVELRRIEAAIDCLDHINEQAFTDGRLSKPGLNADILRRKKMLFDRYNALLDEKVRFIKAKIKSDKQVYAMVIPRILKRGTHLHTCNRQEKIDRILFTQGFSHFGLATERGYSTGFGTGYEARGVYGASEMGEVGHYFTTQRPGVYTDWEHNRGYMIGCSTLGDQEGASILSITELETRCRFTGEQIEAGYKKIHAEYPFLQNGGIGQNTEIVVLKPQGNIRVEEYMVAGQDGGSGNIERRTPIDTYRAGKELHSSWQAAAPKPPVQQESLVGPVGSLPELISVEA